jgi:hypothetical protein
MITMLLGGIWHGAAWKFVAWGGIHGAGLVIGRAVPALPARLLWRIVATLAVFHFVCLAWVFFRADSFDTVMVYVSAAADLTPGVTQASVFTIGLIALGLAMQFVPADLTMRLGRRLLAWPDWALGVVGGTAVVAIDAMGPDGVAPFIYFQF